MSSAKSAFDFCTVRVADLRGNVLGWIARQPCRVTGDRNYTKFDWDAARFPSVAAAEAAAARKAVTIIATNRYGVPA